MNVTNNGHLRYDGSERITPEDWNQLVDIVESIQQRSTELPLTASIAAISLLLAGSKRTISRRGFLGLRA